MKEEIKNYYYEIKSGFVKYKNYFLFALFCGILTHFLFLSNYLINHDSVLSYYSDSSWLITQGKWFAGPISLIKGSLAIKFLQAIIGIVVTAVTGCLIIDILEIKNKIAGYLSLGLLVVFPSAAVCMMYNGFDYFSITAFLAVSSAYFGKNKSVFSFFLAVVFLTLSLGTYQGYIGFAGCIFVTICIKQIFDKNIKFSQILLNGFYYVSVLITSVIAYYVILQVIIKTSGIDLSSYKGIDNMAEILKPSVFLEAIKVAYTTVLGFFWNFNLGPSSTGSIIINRVFLILLIVSFVIMLTKLVLNKQFSKIILGIILFAVFLPLSANLIGILSNNASYYWVTAYSLSMLIICGISIIFEYDNTDKRFLINSKRAVAIISFFVCSAMIFNYFVLVNRQYEKARYASIQLESKITMLAGDIYRTEGFKNDTPVMFIGDGPFEFLNSAGISSVFGQYNIIGFDNADNITFNKDLLINYINNVPGFNFSYKSYDESLEKYSAEISDMQVYPYGESIKIIDDICFVKLS